MTPFELGLTCVLELVIVLACVLSTFFKDSVVQNIVFAVKLQFAILLPGTLLLFVEKQIFFGRWGWL